MKILIPTAKELAKNAVAVKNKKISEKTEIIIEELANKKSEDLAKIYKIKNEKAEEEYAHWQEMKLGKAEYYSALTLFNGLMYRNISRADFDEKDKEYLEKNVYITTALYGIIPALYPIAKHRLDFLQNVKINDQSLKNFWQADYDAAIKNEELVVSLLSSEFEEVFSKLFRKKLIKVKFMEEVEGKLKVHSTISKKARGKFLTELIKRKVESVDDMKEIEFDSFKFNAEHSFENELVFIAKK